MHRLSRYARSPMTRLTRLAASALLAAALAGCSGGQGPTQPDIDRDNPDNGTLEQPPGDEQSSPSPGQSPVDEPDSS